LGLTLFELVTGRRAFQKETVAQTLTAILQDEPEAILTLNPRVPVPLRWLVDRCLAKDPRQRYESTTDLARELRTLRDRLSEFSTGSDVAAPAAPRRRPILVVAAAVALSAAVAIGAFAGRLGVAAVQPLDRYRFTPFATDAVIDVENPLRAEESLLRRGARAAAGVHAAVGCLAGAGHSRDVRLSGSVLVAQRARSVFHVAARDRYGLWSTSTVGGDPSS
jgi:hypothetical protein